MKVKTLAGGRPRAETVLLGLAAAALAAALLAGAGPAQAAFPGANGKIAFDSDRDGNREIYVMNADGSGQVNLTDNPGPDLDPAWSPDGQKIAFTSIRDANWEIYVMNADGSGQTNVTNTPDVDEAQPTWSPDGQRIAFTDVFDIYVMNADGSGRTNLTNDALFNSSPAWSPDGQHIAFVPGFGDGADHIWVMNVDGSGRTDLTNAGAAGYFPAWSPDGSKIAFRRFSDSGVVQQEIFVMNADGSGQTNLTNSSQGDDSAPAWSPDGEKITFTSNLDGNHEIYVMNADGSARTNLTNAAAATDLAPDWQPLSAADPEEELTDLGTLVDSLGLPDGATTSLQSKLTQALADVEAGDIAAACRELAPFLNEVSAQNGKKLTEAQTQQLTDAATEIRLELGC